VALTAEPPRPLTAPVTAAERGLLSKWLNRLADDG